MTDPAPSVDAKLSRLRSQLRDLGSVLVCFSGGTDSAFLLAVAHQELGERAIGLTAVSPSLPESEKEDAARIASHIGATHRLVESNELDIPDYVRNASDRCYHCRSLLYRIAEAKRTEWGLSAVANGTNLDDFDDYRPGLKAATEAQVLSPLADAGFTKADVRAAAEQIGLPIWDKPAAACLSSRLPYGTAVTRERLAQIGGFEADLHALGFGQVRVRWHDTVARLEVTLDQLPRLTDPEIREQVVEAGKRHGFKYVAADLRGYRTGSLNELLEGRQLRVVS